MQSEINATQKEMPNVLFVVGIDIAQMVIRIFKLPLDKKIRTTRVISFFVRFEHGLIVLRTPNVDILELAFEPLK